MSLRSWLKQLSLLTVIYVCFAVVSILGFVRIVRSPSEAMARNMAREISIWLSHQTDESVRSIFLEVQALAQKGETLLGDLWWVDSEGKTLASNNPHPLPSYWNKRPLPVVPLEPYLHAYSTPKQYAVILVKTDPVRYLVGAEEYNWGFAGRQTIGKRIVQYGLFFLLWYLGGAAFLATVTVLVVFRAKSKQAGGVMNAIEAGDLKARFRLTKADEVGGLMVRFNRMADTIEGLVGKLKKSETARVQMLQELNHDLRTPLTSLNVLVETLLDFHDKFPSEKRETVIRNMSKELDYVVRLVQFLFSVAEMEEASYRIDFRRESLRTLVEGEVDHRRSTPFPGGKTLEWEFSAGPGSFEVKADHSLLRRVFRNALDNASKFAGHRVVVSILEEPECWVLSVHDDGPGPSKEAVERFGKRPAKTAELQVLRPAQSIGLGSAILSAVVELHGGKVSLRAGPQGGGLLEIRLPKLSDQASRRAA